MASLAQRRRATPIYACLTKSGLKYRGAWGEGGGGGGEGEEIRRPPSARGVAIDLEMQQKGISKGDL